MMVDLTFPINSVVDMIYEDFGKYLTDPRKRNFCRDMGWEYIKLKIIQPNEIR